MLPDGIFEASLGRQVINAHFQNAGASAATNVQVYVESVSNAGIVVQPRTHFVGPLAGGAARLLSWQADFSACPPGIHHISFIAEDAGGRTRSIKKVFVTKIQFDEATLSFSAETPEGIMTVRLKDLVGPQEMPCCPGRPSQERDKRDLISKLADLFRGHEDDFQFCLPGYLLHDLGIVVTPTPAYSGQYGDLPFQDPFWKVVLCVIAVLLLIAAAIVAAAEGGSVRVTTDPAGSSGPVPDCCGIEASGGSSSYVVAGLVAAAAAAATAAGLGDARDPFRRGQDNTMPAAGELTTQESLDLVFTYPDPVALGRPFAVQTKWEYTRTTTGGAYAHSVSETTTNIHVASAYKITAPDVHYLYHRDPWIVQAEIFDPDGNHFHGSDLLVQCVLAGSEGQYESFVMQDDGLGPDEKPNDGVYTGYFYFSQLEEDARGLWTYCVIAQDTNNAQAGMRPDDAAQTIGGMVLTHQLTLTFDGGVCPFVPDGHVNVI
jgi:hypothetical protein